MPKHTIGKLVGTHGIKGEIKILPLLDDIDILEEISEITINETTYKLSSYRMHKDLLLLKLQGVDDINQAQLLDGYLSANFEDPIKNNQYYIEELKGLKVIHNDIELGEVSDLSVGMQTLLIIKLDKKFAPKSELLLPFVEEYILEVSIDHSYIKVDIDQEIMDLAS